jgi:hypothetical protein
MKMPTYSCRFILSNKRTLSVVLTFSIQFMNLYRQRCTDEFIVIALSQSLKGTNDTTRHIPPNHTYFSARTNNQEHL